MQKLLLVKWSVFSSQQEQACLMSWALDAKHRGARVGIETCPHYLAFSAKKFNSFKILSLCSFAWQAHGRAQLRPITINSRSRASGARQLLKGMGRSRFELGEWRDEHDPGLALGPVDVLGCPWHQMRSSRWSSCCSCSCWRLLHLQQGVQLFLLNICVTRVTKSSLD